MTKFGDYQNGAKTKFEQYLEKTKTDGYDKVIKELRDKSLSQKIKGMLVDEGFQLTKKGFEFMTHSHDNNPNRFNMQSCNRCKFNEREIWCRNMINEIPVDLKIDDSKNPGGPGLLLVRIKVKRGRFDDVIGITWSWK